MNYIEWKRMWWWLILLFWCRNCCILDKVIFWQPNASIFMSEIRKVVVLFKQKVPFSAAKFFGGGQCCSFWRWLKIRKYFHFWFHPEKKLRIVITLFFWELDQKWKFFLRLSHLWYLAFNGLFSKEIGKKISRKLKWEKREEQGWGGYIERYKQN